MVEVETVKGCVGVKVNTGNANLLLIQGKKGFIMCGYLDVDVAEKMGDAACIVRGVNSFDDMLNAEVIRLTSKARELGIMEGMSGSDALELLK